MTKKTHVPAKQSPRPQPKRTERSPTNAERAAQPRRAGKPWSTSAKSGRRGR